MIYKLRSICKKWFSEGKLMASRKDFSRVNFSADETSEWISKQILNDRAFIVSRFGNVELEWYIQQKVMRRNLLIRLYAFFTFQTDVWRLKHRVIKHSYFVPGNIENSLFFERTMDAVIPEIDFLASWSKGETSKYLKLKENIPYTFLFDIEPYKASIPWTLALKGKKVLVINPMVDLFEKQLNERVNLFKKETLPEFELVKLKSLFFDDEVYDTWQKVFEFYEREIPKLDFDVAIIGCGTWGMPICKIVKDLGKGAIHLGGATQLMFGVMGKRWKDWPDYAALVNEYWITEHKEKPKVAEVIEGSCYW